MAEPEVLEGTGEELEFVLKQKPGQRFRLIPLPEKDSKPFYETATAEEWTLAFREWAESHDRKGPSLSDEAVSRDSIYEGRG
jgi:hypothetical protein